MPDYEEHIVVDVTGQNVKNVGGALSSRRPVKYHLEDGTPVKGFFTETSRVRADKELFADSIAAQKAKYPKFTAFYESIEGMPPKHFYSAILKVEHNDSHNLDDRLDYGNVLYNKDAVENRWHWGLQDAHIPETEFAAAWKDPDFEKSLSEFSKTVNKAYQGDSYLKDHGQKTEDNINRRNNAMSEVADQLDCSPLLARSVNMTVVEGGKATHGTFMLNAEGYDLDDMNPYTHPELGRKPIVVTPECKEKIADLQTLDYLCGNLDRHGKNFMYQLDTSDPRQLKLTGIQGIDNDFSFVDTNVLPPSRQQFLVDVPTFGIVSQKMAGKLMKLDRGEFTAIMTRAGINADQMKSAERRLENLRAGIRNGSIKAVSPDFWKQVPMNALAGHSKLFGIVNAITDKQWNKEIRNLREAEMKQRYPERFKKHREIEAGINRSEMDRYHLLDGAARLSEIKKQLDDNTPAGRVNGPEYNRMMAAMEKVIRLSEEAANADRGPSDNQYNELTEAYRELAQTSKSYTDTHGGMHRAMGALRLAKSKELTQIAAEQEHAANEASIRALNAKLKGEAEFIKAGGVKNVETLLNGKIDERKEQLAQIAAAPVRSVKETMTAVSELLVYNMAAMQLKDRQVTDYRAVNALANDKAVKQAADRLAADQSLARWVRNSKPEALNKLAKDPNELDNMTKKAMKLFKIQVPKTAAKAPAVVGNGSKQGPEIGGN